MSIRSAGFGIASVARSIKSISKQRCISSSYNRISTRSNHTFDLTTAVTPKSGENTDFEGVVSGLYSVGDAPNGGYLSTMAIKACRSVLNDPEASPLSISCYFSAKADEGVPATLAVKTISMSKSSATLFVSLSQKDQLRCSFMVMFGNMGRMRGLDHVKDEAPKVPEISACLNATQILRPLLGRKIVKLQNEIDFWIPHDDPFAQSFLKRVQDGPTSNRFLSDNASQEGYVRFAGGSRQPCIDSLAFFADALPPPILNVSTSPWVPTLEYSVQFWGHPNPEEDCLRFRFHTPRVQSGLLYTDGELWTADGSRLLAKSRQLARHLTPK